MIRTSLIRLGGLMAMVSGVLYLVAELLDLPDDVGLRFSYGFLPGGGSLYFNVLLVGAMAATLAIATLYALRRDRDGLVGVVFSVVALVGLALMLWGELGEVVAALLGLLVGSVGVFALGLATIGIGVRGLPRWCGVALMVWGPALVFWLLLPGLGLLAPSLSGVLGGTLAGVSWIVVGFGVFRAATHQTELSSRVQ
jgi:hypothetical protein